MRVCIDIRPLLEQNRSGVGVYTTEILRALEERNTHEYSLFSNARATVKPSDIPKESSRFHHHFSQYPNIALNSSFAFIGQPLIENLTGDFDCLYLSNLNFFATKKPFIVTVHDLSFLRYPHFFSKKQLLWHRLVHPENILKKAAAIIAVSAHTKTDINEIFDIPEQRIHVISPGVSSRFQPQTALEKKRVQQMYKLPEKFFLFLGALEPRKNIKSIITAFEKINCKEHLVIAGGKGWLYQDIFKQAAKSTKKNRIHFLDYVKESDKPGLYATASALIYPSFYEGFGIPPLEAMATGTPLITSYSSSLGEVARNAGLLINPYDINEIAHAMQAITQDSALRKILITRGMERAKQFTWTKSAEALEKIFESCL